MVMKSYEWHLKYLFKHYAEGSGGSQKDVNRGKTVMNDIFQWDIKVKV